MPVVDSHCHVATSWYEPVEVLLHQMDRIGIDQAVLIQMNGQTDNRYQAECVRRYPDRIASVVLVDTQQPDAAEMLEREMAQGASGVRLRPTTRSPGEDPLAIWRAAERLGLAVSCIGATADFSTPAFAEIFQAVPNLSIVVEHLGGNNQPDETVDQRRLVFDLARFPNAYIKIHGLGEFSRRVMPVVEPFPFERPIPPLLDLAYDAFGPRRMMWGSDYPPVSVREGYANALRMTMAELADRGAADRDLIFGGVAAKVFKLRP